VVQPIAVVPPVLTRGLIHLLSGVFLLPHHRHRLVLKGPSFHNRIHRSMKPYTLTLKRRLLHQIRLNRSTAATSAPRLSCRLFFESQDGKGVLTPQNQKYSQLTNQAMLIYIYTYDRENRDPQLVTRPVARRPNDRLSLQRPTVSPTTRRADYSQSNCRPRSQIAPSRAPPPLPGGRL